jgi:hypothetical protein
LEEVQELYADDVDSADATVVLEVATSSSDWPMFIAWPEEHTAVQYSQERLERNVGLQLQAADPQWSVIAYLDGASWKSDAYRVLSTNGE